MTEFLLASELDPATLLERLRRRRRHGGRRRCAAARRSLIDAVQTPEQKEILDRLTAVMTLVEGHGDYVMDAVGPAVVPRSADIRAKFAHRREGGSRARPHGPAAARHRRQDEAVRRGLALRPRGGRPGRHGRLQPRLDLARDPADDEPRSPTPAPGCAACTGSDAGCPPDRDHGPAARRSPTSAGPSAAALADVGDRRAACWRRAAAEPTPWRSPPRWPSSRRARACGRRCYRRPRAPGRLRRTRADVAALAPALGLDPVRDRRRDVGTAGGPEAAASDGPLRRARRGRRRAQARAVLLGHTRDDQAETVLLGLASGAGARSLAGMAAGRGRYRRPLLGARRAPPGAACAALGLAPWEDPHNERPALHPRPGPRTGAARCWRRSSGPGVAEALARTAELARDDADALDAWAAASAVSGLRSERYRRSVRWPCAGWTPPRRRPAPGAAARGASRRARRPAPWRAATSCRWTGWSRRGTGRGRCDLPGGSGRRPAVWHGLILADDVAIAVRRPQVDAADMGKDLERC